MRGYILLFVLAIVVASSLWVARVGVDGTLRCGCRPTVQTPTAVSPDALVLKQQEIREMQRTLGMCEERIDRYTMDKFMKADQYVKCELKRKEAVAAHEELSVRHLLYSNIAAILFAIVMIVFVVGGVKIFEQSQERSRVHRMMRVELQEQMNVTLTGDIGLVSLYGRRRLIANERDKAINCQVRHFRVVYTIVDWQSTGYYINGNTVLVYCDIQLKVLDQCSHLFAHLRTYVEQEHELRELVGDAFHPPSSSSSVVAATSASIATPSASPSILESLSSISSSSSSSPSLASPATTSVATTNLSFVMPWGVRVSTRTLTTSTSDMAKSEREFANLMRSITALWRLTNGKFLVASSTAVALSTGPAVALSTGPAVALSTAPAVSLSTGPAVSRGSNNVSILSTSTTNHPFQKHFCNIIFGEMPLRWEHNDALTKLPSALVVLDAPVDAIVAAMKDAHCRSVL
jgi:hypothetical protein